MYRKRVQELKEGAYMGAVLVSLAEKRVGEWP